MSITSFFQRVGAPLVNTRWSWGALRPSDGAVFLRVWQDHKFVENQQLHVLLDRDAISEPDPRHQGHQERRQHIEKIRAGAPCFLIMCTAVDTAIEPRKIAFFNDDDVFVGGKLVDRDGSVWIEVTGRRPVSAVLQ
jgi:hypothetical protein